MISSISIILWATIGMLLGNLLNVISDRYLKSPARHRKGISLFLFFQNEWADRMPKQTIQTQIPIRYPVGELLLAIVLPLTIHLVGLQWELLVAFTLLFGLYIIVQTDLAEMMIPNRIIMICFAITLLLRLLIHPLSIWNYLFAALLCSGFLFCVWIIFEKRLGKASIGGGDIKLYLFLGLALGIKLTVLSLFLASLIGFVIILPLQLLRSKHRVDPFPFGPFIAIGAWVAYCWGEHMTDWYITLFI